jgi:septum formation protein
MKTTHPAPVLLLASASPRRRQLIARLGLPFEVGVSPLDEEALERCYNGPAEDLGRWLAERKAEAALQLPASAGRVVVTADTTVILDGVSQGKPRDAAHAREILLRLRGREHQVITGVAIGLPEQLGGPQIRSAQCVTPVLMRPYSEAEISAYIASGDPLDKAGAYGVQYPDIHLPERISGCYLNVVGLPLCTLAALLGASGVQTPALSPASGRDDGRCPWSERCLSTAENMI